MPILDPNAFEFISRGAEQTRRIGMRLGELLQPGDLVCLNGDLGSGKTTFVQGVARGWGTGDAVTSPTFVLCNNYRRADGAVMNHLDAYRLRDAQEAEDLDLERMLADGPLLVEWAERIEAALPPERLTVAMTWVSDEWRGMLFTFAGEHGRKLLNHLKSGMVVNLT
jgi:tRNA threonylcarbamoyladenosine biosynthesis protein TsaE